MRLLSLLLVVLVLAVAPARDVGAQAIDTRDATRKLINKDVNGERWAITYDPGRRSVTGNVLLPGGGAAFVDCDVEGSTLGQLELRCFGASDGDWTDLGAVELPFSFFGLSADGCPELPFLFWTFSYRDSCDTRGEAVVDLEQTGCTFSGRTSEASEPTIDGMDVSGTIKPDGSLEFTLIYRGVCQGNASGSGRIASNDPLDPLLEGTASGRTTCCSDLNASFGFAF